MQLEAQGSRACERPLDQSYDLFDRLFQSFFIFFVIVFLTITLFF